MANRNTEYVDEKHERECRYKREWYERNKQKVIDRSAKSKRDLRSWFDEYKSKLSCVQCGENHPACLDFHHRDTQEKEFEITRAISEGYNKTKVLEEIEKCEVLCCKCHRILHWNERKKGDSMQVQVNGQSFTVRDGANISIINNTLYVDGQEYTGEGYESKHFRIEVTGGVASVKAERGDVVVNGNCGPVDAGGSVTVSGSVSGKVDAGGSVNCGNVSGDVDAGGSVNCGSIGGDVDAGGSVRHK